MSVKLYYDLMSQPSRALYIFLKITGIPCEMKTIKLGKLEHLAAEYETINPFKKVPVIEYNGFKLTESIAIVRYLSREFKIPDHWYPSSSKQQAAVDEYLEWQHLNTRMHCSAYFLLKYLKPLLKGVPPKEEKVKVVEMRMNDCLYLIENIWLKDRPFLVGNKISIADIIGTCEIEQPRIAGYEPCKNRPHLTAWMNRVKNETAPFYEEAHALLNQIVENEKKTKPQNFSLL